MRTVFNGRLIDSWIDEGKYLDPSETLFVWYRANGGYYWDDKAEPGGLFGKPKEGPTAVKRIAETFGSEAMARDAEGLPDRIPPSTPYLIETPETDLFEGYKPLEERPLLFLEFAGLKPTREGILEFANRYGMLTRGEEVLTPVYSFEKGQSPPWKHQNVLGHYEFQGRVYGGIFGESLDFWVKEITAMRRLVRVWEWLKDGKADKLRLVIKWADDGRGIRYFLGDEHDLERYAKEGVRYIQDKRGRWIPNVFGEFGWLVVADHSPGDERMLKLFPRGDVVLPARYLLQKKINEKLSPSKGNPVYARLIWNAKTSRLKTYLVPDNLLSAIWFQFSQAVTGKKNVKRCPKCGEWTDISNEKNPAKWRGHKECLGPARSKRRRERVKETLRLWREGVPVEEIERIMAGKGAKPGSVRRWIEDFLKTSEPEQVSD
ncbi:MAG TPA: hypothetical protein GX507_11255 [Clostridia bacterium]|nr:hypothetical protein [Clostridia bacterium]